MVQRYEQMRRLQWYKCGAAYDCKPNAKGLQAKDKEKD